MLVSILQTSPVWVENNKGKHNTGFPTTKQVFFLAIFFTKVCPVFQTFCYPSGSGFIDVFHSLQNTMSHSSLGCSSINSFAPPKCVAVCAEGWGRYIWVSLWVPPAAHSTEDYVCFVILLAGWLFCVLGVASADVGVLVFLPHYLFVTLCLFWCCVTGFEGLGSGLQPAVLHLGSLGFPVSAMFHIHETQTSKKPKKLRLAVAYSFPIYILKRAHAIPL